MSGGQQQRVALGRAIVRDPDVFLMDEPLSNLDAKLRAEMRTEINRLQNDLGVTTLYVTHDQTEAMTMGDRLVVLNYGELQQIGTPLECFYRPANRFVAGFLGSPSMNFFDGRLEGGTLRADGFDYDLTEGMQSAAGNRNELTLGIRPEDMTLHDRASAGHEFEAVVDVVEPMGSVSYVYLRAQGQEAEDTFIVETDGQRPITEGEHVYVEIPDQDVHLFDVGTGETIHQRQLDREAEVALEERMQAVDGQE
jgi:multiple sugar transport system ATP-binding protein